MNTNHPHTFEIEIDRTEFARTIRKYYRDLAVWLVLILSLVPFVSVFSRPMNECESVWGVGGYVSLIAASSFLLAWVLTWLLNISILKRLADRRALKFHAIIEGAFLVIIDGNQDRKTHFRHIHDYTVDFREHRKVPGVGTILMNSFFAGNMPRAHLRIPAVPNALEVRDLLAEVDAERE